MNIEKFTQLYTAQIAIARLLDVLNDIEYPNHELGLILINEVNNICKQYENNNLSDARWLKVPLPLNEAYALHENGVI